MFLFLLTGCFLFLTISCGLDVVYFIDPPNYPTHKPEYNSEFAERYFEFKTNESNSSDDFNFMGTEIYYKIYSRYDDSSVSTDLVSERDSLYSLSVSDNTTTAYTKMTETYGYQKLWCYDEESKSYKDCRVPYTEDSKQVKIRLTDYQDVFPSYISYGDEKFLPVRVNKKSFDFGRNGENDAKPEKGGTDSDLSYTDFDSGYENTFYVALFAVAVGRDISYTLYYSNIVYLGCVPVNSLEEDN